MTALKRASRSALRTLGQGRDEDDVLFLDTRPAALREGAGVDPATLDAIREVFAGLDLVNDAEKIGLVASIRHEVRAEWQHARASFLAIGRALLAAEQKLSPEEFRRMRQSSERLFPFSDAVASQLRQVARAVDCGRLPEPRCPGAYSVAYQITLLNDTDLQLAADRGLVRPDVTRAEVMRFRRERQDVARAPSVRVSLDDLRREQERLRRRRRQMLDELLRIRSRQRDIGRLLGER